MVAWALDLPDQPQRDCAQEEAGAGEPCGHIVLDIQVENLGKAVLAGIPPEVTRQHHFETGQREQQAKRQQKTDAAPRLDDTDHVRGTVGRDHSEFPDGESSFTGWREFDHNRLITPQPRRALRRVGRCEPGRRDGEASALSALAGNISGLNTGIMPETASSGARKQ